MMILQSDLIVKSHLKSGKGTHLIALFGGGAWHLTRLGFGFYGDAVGVHAQHIMHQRLVGPYMLKHLQPGTATPCQAAKLCPAASTAATDTDTDTDTRTGTDTNRNAAMLETQTCMC